MYQDCLNLKMPMPLAQYRCRKEVQQRFVRQGYPSRCTQVLLFIVTLFSSALLCSSCLSWKSADGTRHTLIVGLGLVSTKNSPDDSATAIRSHTLGMAVRTGSTNPGLALGYESLQLTEISPKWEGIVGVSAIPGQPLIVDAYKPEPQLLPNATTTTITEGLE